MQAIDASGNGNPAADRKGFNPLISPENLWRREGSATAVCSRRNPFEPTPARRRRGGRQRGVIPQGIADPLPIAGQKIPHRAGNHRRRGDYVRCATS
jgi:hypothetical protein